MGPVTEAGAVVWRDEPPFVFACFRDGAATILSWPGVRFRVTADRVIVDASHPAAAAELLVPAAWSVVLALRGQEALHGCVVAGERQAVAVLGASGTGKSTAGLALLDRGWRLVTDDLLACDAGGRVLPGPPFLRLTPDRAAGWAGRQDEDGKRRVAALACSAPVLLTAVVVLADEYGACARLTGLAAVRALLGQAYSPLPLHPDQPRRRFELASGLATRVPIYGAAPRSLTADYLERLVAERPS